MNINPENPSNEIEGSIKCGITRRTFIKRTTATAIVTALALEAFRYESLAVEAGSGSAIWRKQKMWAKWTEKAVGAAGLGNLGSNPNFPLPPNDAGIITQLENALRDPNRMKNAFDLQEGEEWYDSLTQEPDTTGCVKFDIQPVAIRSGEHSTNGNVDGLWWEVPSSTEIRTITFTYCIGFKAKAQ